MKYVILTGKPRSKVLTIDDLIGGISRAKFEEAKENANKMRPGKPVTAGALIPCVSKGGKETLRRDSNRTVCVQVNAGDGYHPLICVTGETIQVYHAHRGTAGDFTPAAGDIKKLIYVVPGIKSIDGHTRGIEALEKTGKIADFFITGNWRRPDK
ncbi:MAG: hypothetical protein LBU36_01860 [Clostridiales bacterium]|jgi:hypothetical protein|nr:hypothetical protein [Clostridiales bacterium]